MSFISRKFLLLCVLFALANGQSWFADGQLWVKSRIGDALHSLNQWATYCPYVVDPLPAIKDRLSNFIIAQDSSVSSIIDLATVWSRVRQTAEEHEPLVLVFTGSTGVGKSESGFQLGQALLERPNDGFLNLRGENFSPQSEAGQLGLAEVKARLTASLQTLLSRCDGRGVIVFDEVQKVVPGALDIFLPMMEKRGHLDVYNSATKKWESYSTKNIVLIFTTDIGGPKITELIARYEGRNAVPKDVMQTELFKELDGTWAGNLNKFVKEVIPFMPLGVSEMNAVCKLGVTKLAAASRNKDWYDLVIDDNVVDILVNSSNWYEIHRNGSKFKFLMSKLGARGLEMGQGPLAKLKKYIFKIIDGHERKDKVFHVGLVGESHASLWKLVQSPKFRFYFQWCTPQPEMYLSGSGGQVCPTSSTTAPGTCNSNKIPTPTDAQQRGFAPWMHVPSNLAENKAICETLTIDEW